MASSSLLELTKEDEGPQEELERFDDFTLASSWERFISDIEASVRLWLANESKNLLENGAVHLWFSGSIYKVSFELKYAGKNYCLQYYFGNCDNDKVADWTCTLHDLQLSFGVKEFLVIAPQSASGVVLDGPEATKLLSAVAIALSNCSCLWPAFVPVHDPSRKAYIGIQNMGSIFTRRFEADRIGSQVPVKLMHLEGLYELFVSKFAFLIMEYSTHLLKVHFTMKLTYSKLSYDDDDDDGISGVNVVQRADSETDQPNEKYSNRTSQWDDDCPWSEWYSAEDPVRGFELVVIWLEEMVNSSLEMAELENASPLEAGKWFLAPNLSPYIDEPKGSFVGFASQLCLLVDALNSSFGAQFLEDFVSVEKSNSENLESSTVIPPLTVLDRLLKDLFHEGQHENMNPNPVTVKHLMVNAIYWTEFDALALAPFLMKYSDSSRGKHKNSQMIKGAPLDSLFAQFCLHSLWFGSCNIRAIAVLWIDFVRELRWYWEECQPLPRMMDYGLIDLSTCLVNQKLQMLATCIEKKCKLNRDVPTNDRKDISSSNVEGHTELVRDPFHVHSHLSDANVTPLSDTNISHVSLFTSDVFCDSETHVSEFSPKLDDNMVSDNSINLDYIRRGSAGVVGSMMLLTSHQNMHAPLTQDAPLMTEDMHEERFHAVEAFGDTVNFSAQLERDILSSDMSAFKAANPDAVFEDFIRWHSPGDWVDDVKDSNESGSHSVEVPKGNWPPQGRLSKRMSENGNLWIKIWNDAPALPASEQKLILDPNREGEKILHYLETLRPYHLLEQMICTAFRAAADTLNHANFGASNQMNTKISQLYLSIASVLKSFQGSSISAESEIIEDLKRLCAVFKHVEKLLTVAASFHRKFLLSPRLSESFFADFYNFYVPRMGAGSIQSNEFDSKQIVMRDERSMVANMFTPPSANQSWRKVLSLGNLLNGHEPMVREIIFRTRDQSDGTRYAGPATPISRPPDAVETHRMYIRSTSDDLRVALSVTTCD